MANRGSGLSKLNRLIGVTWRHHSPTIDKNLRTDLLRNHLAIERNRPAGRRVNTIRKPQVRRVLRGIPKPSPPQDAAFTNQVIKPALTNLLGTYVAAGTVILERTNKGERPRDIVIGYDQRHIQLIMHVIIDISELFLNPFVRPTFERSAKVYANHLT